MLRRMIFIPPCSHVMTIHQNGKYSVQAKRLAKCAPRISDVNKAGLLRRAARRRCCASPLTHFVLRQLSCDKSEKDKTSQDK